MKQMYRVEIYEDAAGNAPFRDWISSLKDARAKAKIIVRLDRIRLGNFGDWKPLQNAPNICELRVHDSPGYRVFYVVTITDKEVLILCGANKPNQNKGIAQAKACWDDYVTRKGKQ
jgi:putative addiction module killer protein